MVRDGGATAETFPFKYLRTISYIHGSFLDNAATRTCIIISSTSKRNHRCMRNYANSEQARGRF